MAEDDFFSDDDLDGIPDNTLQELEQNAKFLSSTQRAKPAVQPVRQFQKRQPSHGSTPSRPATASRPANTNTTWRPPQSRPKPLPQAHVQQLNAPPASAPEPPSSDYGFDDEDVVDLAEGSTLVQPSAAHTRPADTAAGPSAVATSRYSARADLDAEAAAAYAAADAELGAQQWAQAPHLQPAAAANDGGIDVSSLQARIAELEADQARLRRAEQDACNAALAKQGEIAIVRANQDKTSKEYERRIEVMRKLHADEAAKTKSELEVGRKEREKMATDNRFLQHDLAQETERAKRLNGTGKVRAAAVAGREEGTPRKSKRTTGLGDGFEDNEVRLVSPTKSKDRPKDQTPKHGAKRKRTANDSPVAALSFTQPAVPARQDSSEQLLSSDAQRTESESAVREDNARYEFMQRLLHHSPYEGHERSVEALTKYAFPSNPTTSLSSALLQLLARSSVQQEAESLPLTLSRVLHTLWSRCLAEHYYTPLYLLLDLIDFALYFELAPAVSKLIEVAVPLCTKTIDLVAVPVIRAKHPQYSATIDRAAQAKLAEEIDVDEVLSLLLRLCRAATLVPGRLEAFWRFVPFEFTLMMLSKAQPISQITAALQLLAYSATATTFGTICGEAEAQARQEQALIDRLTTLLMELPEVPADEPEYEEVEIAELRLEILHILRAMCLTDHSGQLLAQHRHVIGRLIRFLHGQVDKLYAVPPSAALLDMGVGSDNAHDAKRDAHTVVIENVNTTVRIIYHLLRTYEDTIDFNQKLNAVQGGHHKFLISMTRIAFTEQPALVFEQGIEEEVIEAAHVILDSMLSPEEGEAIVRAVETPRGTKGSGLGATIAGAGVGEDVDMGEGG